MRRARQVEADMQEAPDIERIGMQVTMDPWIMRSSKTAILRMFLMTDSPNPYPKTAHLFPDTRPEAEAVLIGLLRQAPPWRKLHMVGQLNQTVRTLALSGLRARHPQAAPQELRRRLADLLLGPDLAALVYGPLEVQESADAV